MVDIVPAVRTRTARGIVCGLVSGVMGVSIFFGAGGADFVFASLGRAYGINRFGKMVATFAPGFIFAAGVWVVVAHGDVALSRSRWQSAAAIGLTVSATWLAVIGMLGTAARSEAIFVLYPVTAVLGALGVWLGVVLGTGNFTEPRTGLVLAGAGLGAFCASAALSIAAPFVLMPFWQMAIAGVLGSKVVEIKLGRNAA